MIPANKQIGELKHAKSGILVDALTTICVWVFQLLILVVSCCFYFVCMMAFGVHGLSSSTLICVNYGPMNVDCRTLTISLFVMYVCLICMLIYYIRKPLRSIISTSEGLANISLLFIAIFSIGLMSIHYSKFFSSPYFGTNKDGVDTFNIAMSSQGATWYFIEFFCFSMVGFILAFGNPKIHIHSVAVPSNVIVWFASVLIMAVILLVHPLASSYDMQPINEKDVKWFETAMTKYYGRCDPIMSGKICPQEVGLETPDTQNFDLKIAGFVYDICARAIFVMCSEIFYISMVDVVMFSISLMKLRHNYQFILIFVFEFLYLWFYPIERLRDATQEISDMTSIIRIGLIRYKFSTSLFSSQFIGSQFLSILVMLTVTRICTILRGGYNVLRFIRLMTVQWSLAWKSIYSTWCVMREFVRMVPTFASAFMVSVKSLDYVYGAKYVYSVCRMMFFYFVVLPLTALLPFIIVMVYNLAVAVMRARRMGPVIVVFSTVYASLFLGNMVPNQDPSQLYNYLNHRLGGKNDRNKWRNSSNRPPTRYKAPPSKPIKHRPLKSEEGSKIMPTYESGSHVLTSNMGLANGWILADWVTWFNTMYNKENATYYSPPNRRGVKIYDNIMHNFYCKMFVSHMGGRKNPVVGATELRCRINQTSDMPCAVTALTLLTRSMFNKNTPDDIAKRALISKYLLDNTEDIRMSGVHVSGVSELCRELKVNLLIISPSDNQDRFCSAINYINQDIQAANSVDELIPHLIAFTDPFSRYSSSSIKFDPMSKWRDQVGHMVFCENAAYSKVTGPTKMNCPIYDDPLKDIKEEQVNNRDLVIYHNNDYDPTKFLTPETQQGDTSVTPDKPASSKASVASESDGEYEPSPNKQGNNVSTLDDNDEEEIEYIFYDPELPPRTQRIVSPLSSQMLNIDHCHTHLPHYTFLFEKDGWKRECEYMYNLCIMLRVFLFHRITHITGSRVGAISKHSWRRPRELGVEEIIRRILPNSSETIYGYCGQAKLCKGCAIYNKEVSRFRMTLRTVVGLARVMFCTFYMWHIPEEIVIKRWEFLNDDGYEYTTPYDDKMEDYTIQKGGGDFAWMVNKRIKSAVEAITHPKKGTQPKIPKAQPQPRNKQYFQTIITLFVLFGFIVSTIGLFCSFNDWTSGAVDSIKTLSRIATLLTPIGILESSVSTFISITQLNPLTKVLSFPIHLVLVLLDDYLPSKLTLEISKVTSFLIMIWFVRVQATREGQQKCWTSITRIGSTSRDHSEDDESITIESAAIVHTGAYELFESTYQNPNYVSLSSSTSVFPYAWRFLFWNARLAPDNIIYMIYEAHGCFMPKSELKPYRGEIPLGHCVPWRDDNSFGSDALIYINEGPINPKTAYRVWNRFSGNNPERPLIILWNNVINAYSVTRDSSNHFNFPFYEMKEGDMIYTWRSSRYELEGHMYDGYEPMWVATKERVSPNMDTGIGLANHIHTFRVAVTFNDQRGKMVPKICKCNSSCLDPQGTFDNLPPVINELNPTHGLILEDYTAIMTHLSVQGDESAQDQVKTFIMSKPSWNRSLPLLNSYANSLLYERHIGRIKSYDPTIMPLQEHMNQRSLRKQRYKANSPLVNFDSLQYDLSDHLMRDPNLVLAGRSCNDNKINKVAKKISKLRAKGDFETADRIRDEFASYYAIGHSFSTTKNDILYQISVALSDFQVEGRRRCFGEAQGVDYTGRGFKCNVCNLYPPKKFKWRKFICPKCTLIIADNEAPQAGLWSQDRLEAGTLGFYAKPGVTKLKYPTPILAANPKYKPKKQREGLKIGSEFTWEEPGYRLPRNLGKYKPASRPSQIIGITPARRATVLNLSEKGIEEQTIKCRLYAKPETGPKKDIFVKAFYIAREVGLLGDKCNKLEPMPVMPYDFTRDGWCARELLEANLATNKNLMKKLAKAKRVLEGLNAEVHHIKDWETGKRNEERFWLQGMVPRKKRVYLKEILEFREDAFFNRSSKSKVDGESVPFQYPRVDFSFFLKRELQPHTCDGYGQRSSLNPRVICNPKPWSQLVLGPFLKKMTEQLHERWDRKSPITYFGGLKPTEANKWLNDCIKDWKAFKEIFDAAIENDFSKFDCTYSPDCFVFVELVYQHWGLDTSHPLISHILKQWQRPCGRFRSGLLVSGPVMNASGRSDTALMNALVNGVVQIISYAMASQGVEDIDHLDIDHLRRVMQNIKIGVLGDDSLTFFRKFPNMANSVGDRVSDFGFEARDMKVHTDPSNMIFLAQRPYPVVDKWGSKSTIWGPTMRKLHKMGVAVDPQENPYSWLYQNTLAALVTSSHVPYIGDTARRQMELLKNYTFVRNNNIEELDSIKYSKHFCSEDISFTNITTIEQKYWFDMEVAEEWLSKIYGVGLEHLYRFQEMLEGIDHVTSVYTDAIMEAMISQDTGA